MTKAAERVPISVCGCQLRIGVATVSDRVAYDLKTGKLDAYGYQLIRGDAESVSEYFGSAEIDVFYADRAVVPKASSGMVVTLNPADFTQPTVILVETNDDVRNLYFDGTFDEKLLSVETCTVRISDDEFRLYTHCYPGSQEDGDDSISTEPYVLYLFDKGESFRLSGSD